MGSITRNFANNILGNITSTGIDDNATSTALTIDSSQNIGIGTISPSTMLHINQGGEPPAEGMLILQANSASRQLRIQPPTNADNGFIDYKGGNLTFLDDGTEVGRFQGSTGFEVTGTIKVSNGIYLGGTAATNLLDDYEEGTFTPTFLPLGGAASTITYSAQNGYYTKIGRMVYYQIELTATSVSLGAGNTQLVLGGLPFSASPNWGFCSFGITGGFTSTDAPQAARAEASIIVLMSSSSSDARDNLSKYMAATSLQNNSSLICGGCYITNV